MNLQQEPKKAIIIGAGPAGLTAAYELLQRTDIIPIVLEKSGDIGGISKTINYKGNRMDIGGHRFFSKSDRVMEWWMKMMPVQQEAGDTFTINYQNKSRTVQPDAGTTPQDPDKVMLVRKRLSRIYFLRKFFTYPIQLSVDTLRKLGLPRTLSIMFSYFKARLFPRKPEKSLEDFFINRFGVTLYELFFKDYTEKVWGIACNQIPAEWGAQRIKGVSISKAIQHAAREIFKKKQTRQDISQKGTETSLIEQFLYPKFGPGQLWEEVARQVQAMGGQIYHHQDVQGIKVNSEPFVDEKGMAGVQKQVSEVTTINSITGETTVWEGDYFFSTMPVKELIGGMEDNIPEEVRSIAAGLQYRDFITVGILLRELSEQDRKTLEWKHLKLKDTWIYIQERDVKVGRLQIFNNWSPYMVKDPDNVWIGMEFFCNTTDDFWKLDDMEIARLAIGELEQMGLASAANVLDHTVLRVEKTYPAYFGSYLQFDKVKDYTNQLSNLFLVGRNGMHKYNNSDHSMLTAMVAVDNIAAGITSKDNIWAINTEQEYHEEKYEDRSGKDEGESQKYEVQREKDEEVNSQWSMVNEGREGDEIPRKKVANRAAKVPEHAPAWFKQEPERAAAMTGVLSFKDFLFKNKRNRTYLWLAGILIVLQFAVFKYLYPFASFINGDSYVYLQTAYHNMSINTYPVGYSNFVRLFSVFTKSDTALVGFQYALLQSCILFFLFTLFYFYRPGKAVQVILLIFLVMNPVFLYLANYVSSDTLFQSLSILWFTTLLWILHRPNARWILLHGIVFFLAFTIRYNALFYPLISILAFLLSRQKLWVKMAGPAFGLLLIGLFIWNTGNKYQKLTGQWQFTPFSGWQMANNAMYTYRYVDSADRVAVPKKFADLDGRIRAYFDSTRNTDRFPTEKIKASTVYMWTPHLPLQSYMNDQFKGKDSTAGKLKRWASMGPLYKEYGSFIIQHYPLKFLEHYIWPNTKKYYAPPVEFLEQYSTGKDSVQPIAQIWFGYKDNKIYSRTGTFDVKVLDWLPIVAGMMNVVFLFGLFAYLSLAGYKQQPWLRRGLWLAVSLWVINFGFSVFASPIALRFQLFPIIVSICFAALFMEFVVRSAFQSEREPAAGKKWALS